MHPARFPLHRAPKPVAARRVRSQPSYARNTAARDVLQTLRDPRVSTVTDDSTRGMLARGALASHHVGTLQHKAAQPERYDPTAPRAVKAHIPGAEISQRLGLGGSRTATATTAAAAVPVSRPRPTEATGQGSGPSAPAAAAVHSAPAEDALQVMSSAVVECLAPFVREGDVAAQRVCEGGDRGGLPPAFAWVDAATGAVDEEHALSEESVVAVLRKLASDAPAVASACLAVPNGFHHTLAVLGPCLKALPESSPAFHAAAGALAAVGQAMVGADSHTTAALAADVGMPLWLPLLEGRPGTRLAVLQVVYAFTPATSAARLGVIRALQERLSSQATLLRCLAVLVYLEPEFDAALLDLYAYYAQIGAALPSPSLRACSLNILSVIAPHDPVLVGGILPDLTGLARDAWWEVQCYLLVLVGSLLPLLREDDLAGAPPQVAGVAAKAVSTARGMVGDILTTDASCTVLRVGVAYLAGCLSSHADLASLWLEALLGLPQAAQLAALGKGSAPAALHLRSAALGPLPLPPAPASWEPVAVAQALAHHVVEGGLQQVEGGLLELMLALLEDGGDSRHSDSKDSEGKEGGPASARGGVVSPLLGVLDLVFVGLCSGDTAPVSVAVLRRLVEVDSAAAGHIFGAPTLVGSLFLVHNPGEGAEIDTAAADVAVQWLAETAAQGPWFADRVREVMQSLQQNYDGAIPRGSALEGVAKQVGAM